MPIRSFEDFLNDLNSGAAGQSSAAPWQGHLYNQQQALRPRVHRPSRPSRGSSSGGARTTLADLERLLDPRLTEGLQNARSQYRTAQVESQALGREDTGEPPEGGLNALLRIIDLPRAVVFNAARTIIDPNMGFDEFVDSVREREGFGELSGLQMAEDDSGIERFFKGAAAFAGDVATDPLSLVSFGATAVGKRLGSEAIQKAIASRAKDFLDEKTVSTFAQRSFSGRAFKAAQDRVVSEEAKAALEALGKQTAHVVDAFGLGRESLGDAAAEAFQLRGATGLRQFLTAPKGYKIADNIEAPGLGDAGQRLWDSLPTDMRGGMRVRVPFAREEGVRRAILVAGGGGRFAEAAGLAPVVERAHQWRGLIRASKAGQAFSRTLGGVDGDLYGQMVADLVHGPANAVEGMSYGLYRTVRQARLEANRTRRGLLQTGNETLGLIQMRLGSAGAEDDVKEAREAFQQWVHNPEELYRLRESASGLETDELGNLFLNLPDGARQLTRNEVLALEQASLYHDTLRDLFRQVLDAGVTVDALNDHYLPRALTEAKKEEMARSKVLGQSLGAKRAEDPTKRREQFVELVAELDDDGVVRSRMRHLSPEEANARAKQRTLALRELGETSGKVDPIDFFETDPGVMLARYVNAMARIASETRFAKAVKDAGGVVTGDVEYNPVLKTRRLGEAALRLDEAADTLRAVPEGVYPKKTRELLGDVDAVRVLLHRLVNDPDLPVEEQMGYLATVFRNLEDMKVPRPPQVPEGQPPLFALEDPSEILEEARKAVRETLSTARKAKVTRPEAGEVSQVFTELGLSPLGTKPGEQKIKLLPPELDLSFAPEQMRVAINKFYEIGKKDASQGFVNRWYRPYLTMFKMTATIGRGPGFHVRNVVGGAWNNHLIGVTEDDYKHASRIVKARVQAGREARKLEADALVERLGASRREVSHMPGFEEAVNRRAEEILRGRLSDVRVNDRYSLYDVHRLMVDHEVDWRPSRFHAIADAEGAGFTPVGVGTVRPKTRVRGHLSRQGADLYPGVERSDLSAAQRGVEKLANLWWVRANAGAAEMSEAFIRGSAFIQGLKQYDDPDVAKLLPLATQFDYDDLSDFERRWLRGSLLPFYTWMRHNVPLQVRALVQTPGRMNRLNLLLDNAEEAFGDDDFDVLPEWMRERFMFVSKFKFDGNPIAFGIETPAQDLNEWFKVGRPLSAIQEMGKMLMSAMNPAFSVPLQNLTGTEFFTGARLDESTGRHAPWWYQALPQSIAPTWVNADGDIMGDSRIIVGLPNAFPWLGQAERVLAIMGVSPNMEGSNRRVSDVIRQLFPVVTAGTLTPESEAGELFQRARRIRANNLRYSDPRDVETVRTLRELGFDIDQISLLMERTRAQRAMTG